jgi:acyl dehydratase
MIPIDTSLYYEDFHIGQEFISKARTITEADIGNFAALSWDHNQLHTDAQYARQTPYGERIAHGLLGVSAHQGLTYQLTQDSILALLEIQWKFLKPIHINDTIHIVQVVTELRESSAGNKGILKFAKEMINQRKEVVQTGTTTILLAMGQR